MTTARLTPFLAAALLTLAGSAQASCYIVMNSRGNVLSETTLPPVDMSKPLHLTVPQRFGPSARMSFGIAERDCGTSIDALGIETSPTMRPAAGRASRATRSSRQAARDS